MSPAPGSVVFRDGQPLVLLTDHDGTPRWFAPDWTPYELEEVQA